MKEIMAFIRPGKVNATKNAFAEAGFPSFTCQAVLGRGKHHIDMNIVDTLVDSGEIPTGHLGEALSESGRLVAKRMFTLIVDDEDVDDIVQLIIKTNNEMTPGDGKIFILPISESYRVRDGQACADAF